MKEQIEEMAKHCFFFEGGCCCTDIQESKTCEDEQKTCGLYQTLKNLYNAGYRKQSEWISVTERMPPALGKVLVYSPILGVYMTCYTAYSPWFAEPSVTHWMPIPQPPEMKGGE